MNKGKLTGSIKMCNGSGVRYDLGTDPIKSLVGTKGVVDDEVWVFIEPHPTGGVATVEITRAEILSLMKPAHNNSSEDATIRGFVSIHWAVRKPQIHKTEADWWL